MKDRIFKNNLTAEYINLSQASEINRLVGNLPCPDKPDQLLKQVYLVKKENEELLKGLEEFNEQEVRNGISDVLFTIHGLYYRMGLELGDLDIFRNIDNLSDAEKNPIKCAENIADRLTVIAIAIEGMSSDTTPVSRSRLVVLYNDIYYYQMAFIRIELMRLAFSLEIDHLVYNDYMQVCDEQYRKFDYTQEDADKTKDKFSGLGVVVYQEIFEDPKTNESIWVTKSSIDQKLQGEDIKAGKWLKSHKFNPAQHTQDNPEKLKAMIKLRTMDYSV